MDVSGPTTVTVTRINDAPTVALGSMSGSIDENNSPPTALTTITVNDPDGGTNDLSLSGTDSGAFSINGSNELEFTETADFETKNSYSVTVNVNDPNVGSDPDDSETFSLSINDVNEAPTVATNSGLTLDEGATSTITQGLLETTDEESAPSDLQYTIDTDVAEGQLRNTDTATDLDQGDTFTQADIDNGEVSYTPNTNYNGSDSFTFTLTDDDGATGVSDETFSIQVNAVNDPPTVSAISDQTIEEDTDLSSVGFTVDDAETSARLAARIAKLRIFRDAAGKMNRSLLDTGGAALVVSQFTLAADTSRGNRPGFSGACPPDEAERLYERFAADLAALGIPVATGRFGAEMAVSLNNDGPVTIWLDTAAP